MCKIVAYCVDGASVDYCFTCKLKPLKPPLALIWQRSHTSEPHTPPLWDRYVNQRGLVRMWVKGEPFTSVTERVRKYFMYIKFAALKLICLPTYTECKVICYMISGYPGDTGWPWVLLPVDGDERKKSNYCTRVDFALRCSCVLMISCSERRHSAILTLSFLPLHLLGPFPDTHTPLTTM